MWFRSTRRTKNASTARTRYFRPQVLALEDRCLLSAGALDTTFGTGGIVTTALTSGQDYNQGVLIQSNGDIIAYGTASGLHHGGGTELARYTPSGSLDSTFGSGGIVTAVPGGGQAGVLQADGKIVLAEGNLVRLNTNGSVDQTFGANGAATFPSGFFANNVIIQPSTGDIVAAGQVNVGNSVAFALVRYTPGGQLDSTFGQGGEVVTQLPGANLLTQSGCAEVGH